MPKHVIYYSNFNLDSIFAAMMVASWMRHSKVIMAKAEITNVIDINNNITVNQDVNVLNSIKNDFEIVTVAYDRSIKFSSFENVEMIYIIGADLAPLHLGRIIQQNPNVDIRIASYLTSEKYNDKISSKITTNLKDTPEFQEHHFNNVSQMIYHSFQTDKFFSDIFPNINQEQFIKLMDSVIKYSNFDLMTTDEVLLVNKNIDNVKYSIENNTSLNFVFDIEPFDNNVYANDIKKIRAIIDRNFIIKYLASGTEYLNIPVLAISHEIALSVMRLISYSHDEMLTYEDNADYRVYRLYTKRNKDWFVKCIKPFDVWSEGNITFMKTEVPSAFAK